MTIMTSQVSFMKNCSYIVIRCMVVAVMLLPTMVYADTRGDKLLEKADSLYGIQQYKEALKVASEALLLTKGTESEADCLNLLAIINIRKWVTNRGQWCDWHRRRRCSSDNMNTKRRRLLCNRSYHTFDRLPTGIRSASLSIRWEWRSCHKTERKRLHYTIVRLPLSSGKWATRIMRCMHTEDCTSVSGSMNQKRPDEA